MQGLVSLHVVKKIAW